VIVYAAVTGIQNGELRRKITSARIYPQIIAGTPVVSDPGLDLPAAFAPCSIWC